MIIEQINNLIEETSQPGVASSFARGFALRLAGGKPTLAHIEHFRNAAKGSRFKHTMDNSLRKSYHAGAIAADAAKVGVGGALVVGAGMKAKDEYDKYRRQKKIDRFLDNYGKARKIVQDSDIARKHVKEFRRWLDR